MGTGATAGRAEFGPDGKLYLTVGDRDAANMTDDNSYRMLAQKLDSDAGKVLRLNDDGSIPADNPFANRADANGAIYTYGHRNAQRPAAAARRVRSAAAAARAPRVVARAARRARARRAARADGLIYVLVERDLQNGPGSARLTPNGSLLRIEPAN